MSSFIAYNTQWLDALKVREQAGQLHKKGMINQEQLQAIQAQYPVGFYTPNIFVRVVLAVMCWILSSSIFGLFGVTILTEMVASEEGIGIVLLFFSAVTLAGLEYFIRTGKHYQSGLDDALLYMALAAGITGLCLIFSSFDDSLTYFMLAFPVLFFGAIRYLDKLVAALVFLCLGGIVFLGLLELGEWVKIVLPFIFMAFSGAACYWLRRNKQKESLRFWEESMTILEGLSLILFYLSGNYLVVRELSEAWFGVTRVPGAFLFYLITAAMPLVYIFFGLRYKDRLLLRIGLVLVVAAVFTFKYYFSLGHTEVLITLSGAFLVVLAYFSIQFLKKGHPVYTYAEDESNNQGILNAEAVLITQSFGGATPLSRQDTLYGGGQFGGGGAGGNY